MSTIKVLKISHSHNFFNRFLIPNSRYLQIGNVTIEEGTATGITNVLSADNAETDGKVYTIDGRLVRTDGSLEGLARGIYIKDGKKYVVR